MAGDSMFTIGSTCISTSAKKKKKKKLNNLEELQAAATSGAAVSYKVTYDQIKSMRTLKFLLW